jgi:hypothetical protein
MIHHPYLPFSREDSDRFHAAIVRQTDADCRPYVFLIPNSLTQIKILDCAHRNVPFCTVRGAVNNCFDEASLIVFASQGDLENA